VEVEVTARCLLFLLEIHHGPILANQVPVPLSVKSKPHILMSKLFISTKGEFFYYFFLYVSLLFFNLN
jgi:hypothetical protein